MHAAAVLVLLLLIGGCQPAAPVVTQTDGSFVSINQPRGVSQLSAKALADQTCGKHATLLSKLCSDPKCREEELTFFCGKVGG